jgi:hypothetical protein
MTNTPPNAPESGAASITTSPNPELVVPNPPRLAEQALNLAAFLSLLITTGVLFFFIGPSAGMVTGTAVGLYTVWRGSGSSPPTGPPTRNRPGDQGPP